MAARDVRAHRHGVAGRDAGPGSVGLVQLLDDGHGGALRADLQRHYGLDLADVWRGNLTPRRVWTLAEHLPDGSALPAALAGGPEHRGWRIETYLLAHLLNAVRYLDANNIRVSGGKVKTDPKPVRTPELPRERTKRTLDLADHPGAIPLPDTYIRG